MKYLTINLFALLFIMLAACSNSKEKVVENTPDPVITPADHPLKRGIDFYAEDTEGNWELTIEYDGTVTFSDKAKGIQFTAKTKNIQVAGGANVVSINAQNKTHIIRINIDIVECMKNGKRVDILFGKRSDKEGDDYSGCGHYTGIPQLYDIWALEKINGEELSPEQFPGDIPHFEFNLKTNQMSGFAGCNRVFGPISFSYNRIHIKPLASTKMYCEGTSSIENEIMTILEGNPIYNLKEGHLTLETQHGSLLLKKVD